MCIVLDTNIWSCVFIRDSLYHAEYAPVLRWITKGPGFIVYGGSKYSDDLRKAPKYQKLFVELRNKHRAKEIITSVIDIQTDIVERAVNNPHCDDAHIIAIFRASGCLLLCSNDRRSDEFIKNRLYYHAGQKLPSIYRAKRHKHLLRTENIVRLKNEA